MVGSVEQITQNLTALDKQIDAIGEEFYATYSSYVATLGQVLRQQLILSCYHVCTEGYPESFLKQSLGQRQQLQQAVRTLAKQAQEKLIAQLRPIGEVAPLEPSPEKPAESAPESPESEDSQASQTADDPPPETAEELLELLLSAARANQKAQSSQPSTPLEILVQWQEDLERAIVHQLQSTSHAANQLLQQSEILPRHLPQPVLEAAAKAESGDPVAGTPNLLNLLVEASEKSPNPDQPKDLSAAILHVVAVHLRLAEIEFNDPTVMVWRNKLRDLKKRLQTLGREYQKKQKERAIAEAQVAWRSTWSNE